MWWRMYTYKTKPLPSKSDFRDKIFNGDFDPSCYQLQAWLCEHELFDLWEECEMDIAKWNEKGAVTKARKKRLLEDYEKDEAYRLDYLFTEFSKNFDNKIRSQTLISYLKNKKKYHLLRDCYFIFIII